MKNNTRKVEWFKVKGYPHIGLPIEWKDKKRVCSYVKNPKCIERHSFMPFIHKEIFSKKYRKEYDIKGNVLNDKNRTFLKPKIRHLYYSNHLDANIFSYYGFILNKEYEKKLVSIGLDEAVTAYRKIPLYDTDGELIRNKCNIDFANDVFKFIKESPKKKVTAITFDIKGFFDNLDHKILKESWCNILDSTTLPMHHYNVYKNITKFAFVEEYHLFNLFSDKIITRAKSGIVKKQIVQKIQYLQNQNAIAFCEKKDIHKIRKAGLIRTNKFVNGKLRDFGICQGSPISSVLANMYMLPFDELINEEVQKVNGMYKRYSDDIVIVCPKKHSKDLVKLVRKKITSLVKLEIQKTKTQKFQFYKENGRLVCRQEFKKGLNKNSWKRKFEYLGFSFDGETVSIKTSGLAKYYRKLKLNARRGSYFASVIDNNTKGQLFKRRLYKKFSYKGAFRSIKYERIRGTTNKWRKTKKYNWGNFITYAKLAAKTIDGNNIKSQIKNHWRILNEEIRKASK